MDQLFGERLILIRVVGRKAIVNADITIYRPSELVEPLLECHEACLHSRIILGIARQHADPSYLLGLLRARRERPGRRRAAEQRYERAPFHSIPLSARASKVGGISRPRALAVLRLMISSNLAEACTGRSAGLVPLRMRSTYVAACR